MKDGIMQPPKPKPELSKSEEPNPTKAGKVQRLGFLKGQITVPEDFDTMFSKEIEEMFYGSE
ncbi:MAG TPA: hypothetical protein VK684_10865 [Edaphobacter sp.]|jgi:hypothetical protein|nr:hypothetical protein [Edaphobacter sp.]